MTTSTQHNIIEILKPGPPSPLNMSLKGPKAILKDIIISDADTDIKDRVENIIESLVNLLKGGNNTDINDLIENIKTVLCDSDSNCTRSFDNVSKDIRRELESLKKRGDFVEKLEILYNIYKKCLGINIKKRRANRSVLLLFNVGKRYEKYVGALEKLVEIGSTSRNDKKYLLTVLNTYYQLNKNYGVFNDIEWFLVLLSAWASKISGSEKWYLPICPTKTHVVVASYHCIVRDCPGDSNVIDRDSFVELIKSLLGLTDSSSSGGSATSSSGSTSSTS